MPGNPEYKDAAGKVALAIAFLEMAIKFLGPNDRGTISTGLQEAIRRLREQVLNRLPTVASAVPVQSAEVGGALARRVALAIVSAITNLRDAAAFLSSHQDLISVILEVVEYLITAAQSLYPSVEIPEVPVHASFDDLATRLLRKMQADRLPGGMGDGADITQFDPIELGTGVIEEMEHTDDPALAIEIAQDHLVEDPHFYTHSEEACPDDKMASLIRVGSILSQDLTPGHLRGLGKLVASMDQDIPSEEWSNQIEAFLLDAPSQTTTLIDPPGFMERGLEPEEGYDSDNYDPYRGYPTEPRRNWPKYK